MTLQYKHIIRTLSGNIKFISTRLETERTPRHNLTFLSVYRARTNKLYIYRQYKYIIYIPFYLAMTAFIDQYSLPNIFLILVSYK